MIRTAIMTVSVAAFPLVAPAQVLVPEGAEGSVLHVDAAASKAARITGLDNVHGLAVAPRSGLIVAGSLSETPRKESTAVAKPVGVSEADHEVHHGGSKDADMASEMISIVTVLDLDSHEISSRIEVPGMVHHVEISPDERFAAVTHPGLDGISIIELSNGKVTTIDTGPMPEYAVADAKSGNFLVSNAGNGTISEVDPERAVVLRNIVLDGGPKHMQLTTDQRLVVAEADEGMVSIVDVATGTTSQRYDIGGELHGVQSDGASVYIAARERNMIVRVDLDTGKKSERALGPEPYHATLVGDALYVSSASEPRVWVIDPVTLETRDEIETNGVAHQMAPLPAG